MDYWETTGSDFQDSQDPEYLFGSVRELGPFLAKNHKEIYTPRLSYSQLLFTKKPGFGLGLMYRKMVKIGIKIPDGFEMSFIPHFDTEAARQEKQLKWKNEQDQLFVPENEDDENTPPRVLDYNSSHYDRGPAIQIHRRRAEEGEEIDLEYGLNAMIESMEYDIAQRDFEQQQQEFELNERILVGSIAVIDRRIDNTMPTWFDKITNRHVFRHTVRSLFWISETLGLTTIRFPKPPMPFRRLTLKRCVEISMHLYNGRIKTLCRFCGRLHKSKSCEVPPRGHHKYIIKLYNVNLPANVFQDKMRCLECFHEVRSHSQTCSKVRRSSRSSNRVQYNRH